MTIVLRPEGTSITTKFLSSRSLESPFPHFPPRVIKFPRRNLHNIPLKVSRASADSIIEELGLSGVDLRNPSLSSSHRPSWIRPPNQTVLEAQTKVCTGPTQTRPLGEDQAFKVLDTILRSAKGELKEEEEVSQAQMGAFFAAMALRANDFPEETQWSEGETRAMKEFWPQFRKTLPPEILFIADPEGTIMGGTRAGPQFVGKNTSEMRLVGALREVLAGGHLGYEEVKGVLGDVLPLESGREDSRVSEALIAAFLIGQRMNRETDRELKGYCLAFDEDSGLVPRADVASLTHYGEPYDGNNRFFRSTLFVAAVRACYGESCLLHGVDWMPPKGGVTEEQMLRFMGANTHLSPLQAKKLIEDEDVGLAYVSQREACPPVYSLVGLREHIKKRPPLATTEKVQQIVRARGRESIIAGFYHEGYVESLLMLMKRRGVHSGLVVKGEEGALSMTTKARSENASKGLPVNYCSGFCQKDMDSSHDVDGISLQSFSMVVNATDYGFESSDTPRTDRSVVRNIELGLAALSGEKGPAYDRIVLNAGMADYLLGSPGAPDPLAAFARAREAIDSGKALRRLISYIKSSHKFT